MGSMRGCRSQSSPAIVDESVSDCRISVGTKSPARSRDARSPDARKALVCSIAEGRIRRKAWVWVKWSCPAGSRKVDASSPSPPGSCRSVGRRRLRSARLAEILTGGGGSNPHSLWRPDTVPAQVWFWRPGEAKHGACGVNTTRWQPVRTQPPELPAVRYRDRRMHKPAAQKASTRRPESAKWGML